MSLAGRGFFMEKFAAIPTKYNGVQFRSRLEAKWAAFFDLCNWKWEYEPIDLPGWIPDFIIKGKENFLVEVKPFYTENDPEYDDDFDYKDSEWEAEIDKILRAKPDTHVLLLGNGFYLPKYFSRKNSHYLGGCLYLPDSPDYFIDYVYLSHDTPPRITSWMDSMDSKEFQLKPGLKGFIPELSLDVMLRYWKEAGNITQWKASKY